jgi:hypothetical protein
MSRRAVPAILGAAVVLLLAGACSSNTHRVKTTNGTSTSTSSTSTTVAVAAVTGTTATPGAPVTAAPKPPTTTSAAAPPTTLAATSPDGPPPAQATGRGAIAGHVYSSCGNGQPSGCRSQAGVGGKTLEVKSGGATVASTTTAADGTYRVEVLAGSYDVGVAGEGSTRRVVVNAGQTVAVDFTVG